MNLAVLGTVFILILLAELPDKTALASLVLGSRYPPMHVFAGAAAAFTIHVALAVAAGSLLTLLPHRVLQAIIGALFLLGALLLLGGRHGGQEDEHPAISEGPAPTFPRVAGTSFLVILAAEFGDLTQIVTVNLAGKYHDPLSVGVGAVLALWAVAGLAIGGGRSLQRVVPIAVITRIAAAVMAVLAAVSIVSAIRG